jgi:hypothetical protein
MEQIQHTFNDFIGKETLNSEFKEFTFHNSGLTIDNQLAESYCQNYNFDFNSNVIQNIKRYIKFYLPKYTCAFLNSNIPGELYIGVNDYGFIKGIPYQGELPIDSIKKRIHETIRTSVKSSIGCVFNLEKLISIDILKVDNPSIPTKPAPQSFTNYLVQKQEFIEEYNGFVEKFKSWKIRHNFFTQKLVELVNNVESRMMLIEYIRRNNPDSPVIGILESDYVLQSHTHDEITILKDDPTNPYYWICRWKDEMVDTMNKNKPVFNEPAFCPAIPYNLITSMSELIPYWIHNNQNMNLFMIRIKFNTLMGTFGVCSSSKLFFSYLSHNDKNWISCYRNVLPDGELVCTPY